MSQKKRLTLGYPIAIMGLLVLVIMAASLFLDTQWTTSNVDAQSQQRISEIEDEIGNLDGSKEETEEMRQELQAELNSLKFEREKHMEDLRALDLQMNHTALQIDDKQVEIDHTEEEARQVAQQLKEAEIRVEERNELIRARVRSMYESGGSVTYIEVLLGSSSIADFLQRMDFLGFITQRDQQILDDHVKDKELVEQQKAEIERLLTQLEIQLSELESLRVQLKQQEQQKRVQIATIEEQQGELEKLDEEMQQEMLNIANERSRLMQEKQEIQVELRRIEEERKQQNQQSNSGNVHAQFAWPVQGYHRITSPFGYRIHPIHGGRRLHSGMDVGAPQGANILAAESGIVTYTGYRGGYGNTVIIEHGDGLRTLYAHIRHGGIMTSEGATVQRGQKVAEVGTTGTSTAPHLHFEVHRNGSAVDPRPFVR